MRDIFLVGIVFLGLLASLRYPFAGILLWTWFTCMDPHQEAYGFAQTAPLNLIIACVTIASWVVSKERKIPPRDAAIILVFAFLIWITVNGFFAIDPDRSWPLWERTWKTIALGLFISVMATNKIRVHALVWVTVLSLFYYGIKGGVFTIMTGGHNHVLGAENSMIGDNNQLAVALLMVLPLANYLRLHSARRWVSWSLLAGMVLTMIATLGTYSRGAFIALGGLSVVAWFRSRNKFVYPIAAALVLIPAFFLMPQAYVDRLNTIGTADPDDSFHGRVVAWQVAWRYALDHIPFGNGFSCSELPQVFNRYFPGEVTHAAHSIYFEVLGDNGLMGLAIYLGIILTVFLMYSRVRKLSRGKPELSWAFDLAGMAQLSLFVFGLGGAALSMAYYDIFFILVGLGSAMNVIVTTAVKGSAAGSVKFRAPDPGVPQLAGAVVGAGLQSTASFDKS